MGRDPASIKCRVDCCTMSGGQSCPLFSSRESFAGKMLHSLSYMGEVWVSQSFFWVNLYVCMWFVVLVFFSSSFLDGASLLQAFSALHHCKSLFEGCCFPHIWNYLSHCTARNKSPPAFQKCVSATLSYTFVSREALPALCCFLMLSPPLVPHFGDTICGIRA